jgi:hypothetical protein
VGAGDMAGADGRSLLSTTQNKSCILAERNVPVISPAVL